MRERRRWGKLIRCANVVPLLFVFVVSLGSGPAVWAQADKETLTVAASGDIQGIDPNVSAGAPFQNEVIRNLNNSLVDFGLRRTESGELVGDFNRIAGVLAKSFVASPDGATVTFRLRDDAQFPDGSPITADAVKYSFDRMFGVNAGATFLLKMATVSAPDHVKVVSPSAVGITMDKPNPLLYGNLAQFSAAIVDPAVVKAHATSSDPWATEWMKTHAAGAGPFVLEEWTPGSQIVLARNEHYWAGPAKLKRIVFKVVPDAATRALLIRRGAVDMAMDLSLQDIATMQQTPSPNVVIRRYQTTIAYYIGMNVNTKPFDDLRVRQAIAYAVPYDTILRDAVKGYGRPLHSPLPAGIASHDDNVWMYDTNAQRAKQLLAEAGLGGGFGVKLTIRAGFAEDQQMAVWVQSALRPLGVNVEIETLPLAGFTERLLKRQLPFFIHSWLSISNDPYYHYYLLFQQNCCNFGNFQDPKVTALIGANMLTTNTTLRAAASRQIQKIIMEDAPWVFLYQPDYIITMTSHVKGFIFYPERYTHYYTLSKQ